MTADAARFDSRCIGRVLAADGTVLGSCVQLAPGIAATAWHVVATAPGTAIDVAGLDGSQRRAATLLASDPPADLALLELDEPLPASAVRVAASDDVPVGTEIFVTGVAAPSGEVHTGVAGGWAGRTLRDGQLAGCLRADDVAARLRGAPIVRCSDGALIGLVSTPCDQATRWLADLVLVARTERLPVLAGAHATVTIAHDQPPAGIDLVIDATRDRVRLSGAGVEVSAPKPPVPAALDRALASICRARARAGATRDGATALLSPEAVALDRAGGLLAETFLPDALSGPLTACLDRAEAGHEPLHIGIVCDDDLDRLPWEALPDPRGGTPLALNPLVRIFRRGPAVAVASVPGPLRILVAISSPEHGGMLLDYERELRNVLAAVRAARGGDAQVRVVQFATTAEIRAALAAEPAHVLHVTCHGRPGVLELEHADGSARDVDAKTFVDEAIPPGRMPPVVALAACHTNVRPGYGEPSFATALRRRGAAAVIASETAVTDMYAVEVFARAYGRLAEAAVPDVVAAFCDARREAQEQLAAAPDERRQVVAELAEWASMSVLSFAGRVAIFDPAVGAPVAAPPPRLAIAQATPRPVGTFVGRRTELRRCPERLLADERCGLVVHGIGGIGKTSLASEIIARVVERAPERVPAIVHGQLRVESLIGAIVDAARRRLLIQRRLTGDAARALELAAGQEQPWRQRMTALREHVFEALPLLVVLDNFEDNLERPDGVGPVAGELAELLTSIARDPGALRLLITSRFAFTLPGGAERCLEFAPLGALSEAETRKLVWALPGLDQLAEHEVEQLWRLVGGHPRSLEYVDALLSGGHGRFADIDDRLTRAIRLRLDDAQTAALLGAEWRLDTAVAQVATIAADDVLLDELLARLDDVVGARALVVGASVYREPIDDNALLFACGKIDITAPVVERRASTVAGAIADASRALMIQPASTGAAPPSPPRIAPRNYDVMLEICLQSSLLSSHPGVTDRERRLFVHRWTASELERRIRDEGPGGPLRDAHRRAAQYWQWRADVWPQDAAGRAHDLLEARYHLVVAGDTQRVGELTSLACTVLQAVGRWAEEEALLGDTLAMMPPDSGWRGPLLQRLGVAAQLRGDLEEAERLYANALEVLGAQGNADAVAAVHHQLGLLAGRRSQLAEAERCFRLVIAMAADHPDRVDATASICELGSLALDRGDVDEAERRFRTALAAVEARGDELRSATILHRLGTAAALRGDLAGATEQHARARDIRVRYDDRLGIASSEFQLGRMAWERADYPAAERHYTASLEIEERLGHASGVAASLGALGTVARACGDLDDAEHHFLRALELMEQLEDRHGIGNTHHELGLLARERGQIATAEQHYRRARDIFESLGDQAALGTSHHELATVALRRGDLDGAEAGYRAALAINEAIAHPALGAQNRCMLGFIARERGDFGAARAAYLESLHVFTHLKMRADAGLALSQLGRLAEVEGDRVDAVGWHARALLVRQFVSGDFGVVDAESLMDLRAKMGERRFRRALTRALDSDLQVRRVLSVVDMRTRALDGA